MNTADWIDEQKTVIHDGVGVALVKLVAGDETPFGTWSIGVERLAERIDTLLGQLPAELPKGRHQFWLRAVDEKGLTLAQRPVNLTGQSQAATQALENAHSMAKSQALVAQMSEQQVAAAHQRSQVAEDRAIQYAEASFSLAESYMRIKQRILDDDREEKIAQLRHVERMEIIENLKPLAAPIGEAIADVIRKKAGLA